MTKQEQFILWAGWCMTVFCTSFILSGLSVGAFK